MYPSDVRASLPLLFSLRRQEALTSAVPRKSDQRRRTTEIELDVHGMRRSSPMRESSDDASDDHEEGHQEPDRDPPFVKVEVSSGSSWREENSSLLAVERGMLVSMTMTQHAFSLRWRKSSCWGEGQRSPS